MEPMIRKKPHETEDRPPSARGGGRPPVGSMRDLLAGGDLLSIGRVPEVLRIVERDPARRKKLVVSSAASIPRFAVAPPTPAMRARGRKLLSLLKEEKNVL